MILDRMQGSGGQTGEAERVAAAYARRAERVRDGRDSWADPAHLYNVQERERRVLKLLRERGIWPLKGRTVLEVGCGTGYWLRALVQWGAEPNDVAGIDIRADAVARARATSPPQMHIVCGDAAAMPFEPKSFDVVLQSTAFTSMPRREVRSAAASEVLRVLRPGGLFVWYDYGVPSPYNPDVRAVRPREIRELFPTCEIDVQWMTLAPPIARIVAPRSVLACHMLSLLRPLRTHLLAAIQKPR